MTITIPDKLIDGLLKDLSSIQRIILQSNTGENTNSEYGAIYSLIDIIKKNRKLKGE